jgi:hypothetical protein
MVAWGRTTWRDFLDMAGAVIAAWRVMAVPLVAGGLVTAYDRATGVAVDAAVLEVPLLIAFVLAFFVAWQKRQRILEAAQRDLDEARKDSKLPALFGYIRIVGKGAAKDDDRPLFFAYIEIRNDGFRSVVKDFCPAVNLNGREHLGHLARTASAVRITLPNGTKEVLYEKDAIYNRTKVPIEPGDVRAGHLHFFFDKTVGAIDKHLLKVYFRDYRNRTFETEPIDPEDTVDMRAVGLPNLAGMFSQEQYARDEDVNDKGDNENG